MARQDKNRPLPQGASLEGASHPRLRVGFVLAQKFTLTALAGFMDAVRLAADEGDGSRQIDCQWAILATKAGDQIEASCGLTVVAWDEFVEPSRFDYIVVVGGLLHDGQKLCPGTRDFLRLAVRAGVPLVGLCTGSFILARLGLLDGYETCVSIFHRDEFIDEFPDLSVQSDRMFVVDRDRITCTGGTSVVHVAGHLIEKHCSRAQALKSVRRLAEEQLLPSSAWQPEAVVTHQARDGLVREAMLLIEQDLADNHSLAALTGRPGFSVRQLQRRFLGDVGISPREYRRRLRMARARWMVENTNRSMTEIALECGFNDGAHFARAFREQFDLSPSEARRRARPATSSPSLIRDAPTAGAISGHRR